MYKMFFKFLVYFFLGLLEDLKSCMKAKVSTKEVANPIMATVKKTIASKSL